MPPTEHRNSHEGSKSGSGSNSEDLDRPLNLSDDIDETPDEKKPAASHGH